MRGQFIQVPVNESNNALRGARFGWKNQHASLVSFSADAYLNEMGITSPTFPEENTSSGRFVGFGTPFDRFAEPENDGEDVVAFADFMRATKAPPRGPITAKVRAGEQVRAAGTRIDGRRISRRIAPRKVRRVETNRACGWSVSR